MENPHGFTRDVEVENAAFNMGWPAEKIKRERIMVVREFVQQHVQHLNEDDTIPEEEEEEPQVMLPTPLPARPRTPVAPSEINQNVMAPSELGLLGGPAVSTIRQVTLPEDDSELKGLEHLTMPLNVNQWCLQDDGVLKLSGHVHRVLKVANELETAVREKQQIVAMHKTVLDQQDVEWISSSVDADTRKLMVLYKWLVAVMDDLDQLIRLRLGVQSRLQRTPGDNVELCKKLHKKTMGMRALHTVMQARCETMQIPKPPAKAVEAAQAQ